MSYEIVFILKRFLEKNLIVYFVFCVIDLIYKLLQCKIKKHDL